MTEANVVHLHERRERILATFLAALDERPWARGMPDLLPLIASAVPDATGKEIASAILLDYRKRFMRTPDTPSVET